MDAAAADDRPAFRMESDGYYYFEMPISAVHAAASRYDRVIARAGLENILVTFYEHSDFLFRAEGEERIAKAGDIVALDLSRRSQIATRESRSIALLVPRPLLSSLTANLDDTHGLVLPKGSPLNALLLSHMRELLIQAPRLDPVAGQAMTRATAALVAACPGTAKVDPSFWRGNFISRVPGSTECSSHSAG
jgi:hypothetical protein